MKQNTIVTLADMKARGEKISQLTCYDYSTARLMDQAGINMILVGDSLGMTMQGYSDTIPVTMEEMIVYGRSVVRGCENTFVVVDMPFMSYQASVEQAVVNAGITFRFKTQAERGFDETTYVYENGIADYVAELAGEHAHTPIQFWTGERVGRDRPDKPDYKVKLSCAFCFCS